MLYLELIIYLECIRIEVDKQSKILIKISKAMEYIKLNI